MIRTVTDDNKEFVMLNPKILKIGSALMLMCSIFVNLS